MRYLSLAVMSLLPSGAVAAGRPWNAPTGPHAELLHQQLVIERHEGTAALAPLIALGTEIVDELEQYLSHPDSSVRCRALYTLSRVPSVARRNVIQALSSDDQELRLCAMSYCSHHLLDVPEVRIAFVGQVISEQSSDVMRHTLRGLRECRPEVLEPLLRELVPEVLTQLPTYKARTTQHIVMFLGETSPPHDQSVLESLAELRQSVPVLAEGPWKKHYPKDTERDVARALEAIQFAEANLGAGAAFDAYRRDAFEGPNETRVSRLELLHRFRPTGDLLAFVSTLLDDRTPLRNVAPSHLRQKIFKRACDFGITTLGVWFEDFPVKTAHNVVYSDEDLQRAKEWLTARMAD